MRRHRYGVLYVTQVVVLSVLRCSGTGKVDFNEFKTVVEKKLKQEADEKELKEIFRVLDKEKKGEVNVSELR